MTIATFKNTSIKELVANTKLELRLVDTTAEDIYIERYVRLCAAAMKTQLDYVTLTKTLTIENYQATLPCGFVRFNAPYPITFTTNGVADTTAYYANWNIFYNGTAYLECSPYNTEHQQYGVPMVRVQAGKLLFSNNIDATECTIGGLFVREDENGEMIIPAVNGRTIVCGAAFMYNNSIGKADPVNAGFWSRGVQDARAEANQPDSLEEQRLAMIWNSML